MDIFTIDLEGFFDTVSGYTLKKMTTEAYVRDERFEAYGWAVRWPDGRMQWVTDGEMRTFAWRERLSSAAVLCHHAHFDLLVLNHHYNIRPAFILDTLSMGRVCFGPEQKLGLGALANHFGLAPKSVPYDAFNGKHWSELDLAMQMGVSIGAEHDVKLTWDIANYMLAGHAVVPYPFPVSELPVIDATVRMFTEPTLVGDIDALAAAWSAEEAAKQELFRELGVTGADLRKDDIFARRLEEVGIEPALKTTAKGNEKYAFAKSDWFMQDLVTHEDERVALLAEARLKAQSSIYQTRAERLGWMATRGPMCVYLAYAAAHTRRWGGGDKMNWQNLPRPDPAKPQKGALRRAIKAP
jgi:hypothetical protein